MIRKLMRPCAWLPLLVLGACGPSQELEEAPALAESAQAVLYAPPAPASGNIIDSTAFLGPVALGSAVQTQFTTNPQYLSFNFNVRAGALVKLEVTHLGSSMYLDTGLFVYGPRQADGSYGTTPRAVDDDSGYGQLSKLASLSLPQGGEYLAVVSTGTGAGKRFRLQLDCLNGACDPNPSPYATCDLYIATNIEECVEGAVEEYRVPLAEAYAMCTGPDDAHAFYGEVCNGTSTAPAWCAGGEAPYTQQMWPVCQDFYKHYYGLYTLTLSPMPVPLKLEADVDTANDRCSDWCESSLKTYTFPWTSTAAPRLDKVAEAALATDPAYGYYPYVYSGELTFPQFMDQVSIFWSAFDPDLLTELGNGTEQVRIAHYQYDWMAAPSAMEWNDLYIVLFPQSNRVAVFHMTFWEI